MGAVTIPTGYSGASAIAAVQNYTNEPTFPSQAVILTFLNKGLEEVERRIGGIHLFAAYPTVVNQTTIQLNNDVQDIESANFSMGQANSQNTGNASPFAQGTLVYPMVQMSQAQFMDAAAGFPAVGFGPPQAFFIYQDAGQSPATALAPPPQPQLSAVPDTSAFLTWNVGQWNKFFWFGVEQIGTVEVVTTYVNQNGETTQSVPADQFLNLGQAVQVASPPAEGNATGYNVYAGNVNDPYFLQNSTPIALGTSFVIPPPFSTSGPNPPTTNTTAGASQEGGTLFMQLYPAAMVGQVNIYYRARPQLWADTTTSSWTNLDTSLQEAAVIFAVGRVLMNRGRAIEWAQIWKAEYEALVADMKESSNRRTTPKSSQVRDVRNRAYPNSPWWI